MASSADTPDWLREALRRRGTPPLPPPDGELCVSTPEPGQLRVALPMDLSPNSQPRLTLVFEVQLEGDPWVNAFLVAEGPDVVTASDIRLETSETGLPFVVAVETDVVGPLFVAQLGPVLGRVGSGVLRDLQRELEGERSPRFEGRRGLPVFSNEDPRWVWKDRELATMQALTYPCMKVDLELAMTAPEPTVLVDPVTTGAVAEAKDPTERLGRLLRLLNAGGAHGATGIEVVLADTSQGRSLIEGVAELGIDALRAAEPALAGAFRGAIDVPPRTKWRPVWPSSGRQALEPRLVARAAAGMRACRVVTRRDPLLPAASVYVLEIYGVGMVQVKPEHIEEDPT